MYKYCVTSQACSYELMSKHNILDPRNFGSKYININSLTADTMVKCSRNTCTNKIKDFVFHFDFEEECGSNVYDNECTYDIKTK